MGNKTRGVGRRAAGRGVFGPPSASLGDRRPGQYGGNRISDTLDVRSTREIIVDAHLRFRLLDVEVFDEQRHLVQTSSAGLNDQLTAELNDFHLVV